ncbi:hypothetical protein CBS101457_006099 [Exobasidium rhododendri]|nr:hypothetical protein CBS101457_006099 [Exobasidium rhododendri]
MNMESRRRRERASMGLQRQRRGGPLPIMINSTGVNFSPLQTSFNHRFSDLTQGRISVREGVKNVSDLPGYSVPSAQPKIFTAISRPRLNRSQSLPNFKAKPVTDVNLPASHRLALPPRLMEYLMSLRNQSQRQFQQSTLDTAASASSPLSTQRDHLTINTTSSPATTAAQASSSARNGYSTTTIDSMGIIKTIFIPSLHPPITRQTLKELDLHEILKNPQLRHDIVFDANVQFRPNFDGERGKKKREFGNKYWFAVQKEIETGCTCTSFCGKVLLSCICGQDQGKKSMSRISSQVSSIKSPLPSQVNYAHSGSGINDLSSALDKRQGAATPAVAAAAAATAASPPPFISASSTNARSSPRSAIGLGGVGRIPSRIPLLIQELRTICLSVLPSPTSNAEAASTAIRPASAKLPATVPSSAMMESLRKPPPQAVIHSLSSFSSSSTTSRFMNQSSLNGNLSVATHHMLITQMLDSHLITQQIQHGVLDIASLMSFLGSILKLHCAPMRDEVIEKMIKTICVEGEVAVGLRMCFEILELMKLDIANHQLRSSRTYLIETAVDFELRWFRDQLDQAKMSLDRTNQWFSKSFCQQKNDTSSTTLTRTDMISKAFDGGLLQLIFEPPLAITGCGGNDSSSSTSSSLSPNVVGASSVLSSASLNHVYTNSYPETFQFDAFRLMTFHGDVTDITIVYMFLLLFRQLACSTSNLAQQAQVPTSLTASTVLENASSIASRQLSSVKSEIWTLLNNADMEASPSSIAAANAGTSAPAAVPRLPTTPGLTGRVLSYNAVSGSFKLENPTWRKAMNDVVLQIAARAIEVQIQARKNSKDRSTSTPCPPPSEDTMKLLMCWMEANLKRGSALHDLCQSRLKTVLCAFLNDGKSDAKASKSVRKEREGEIEGSNDDSTSSKRIRLQQGSVGVDVKRNNINNTSTEIVEKSEVERAIQKGGLEPFAAEMNLLSERINKVKTFHSRVFRCVYEKIAGDMQ